MDRQRFLTRYAYAAGALGWVALLLQLQLHLHAAAARGIAAPTALLNYFSYFTILSNILAALALTAPRFFGKSALGRFFVRPSVRHGIAVCVAVVAIVYNTVLRGLWNPEGLQIAVDNLLHGVLPVLFLGYWYFDVPGKTWSWAALSRGALFPLGYLGFSLARGTIDGWVPYPFLDAAKLGYPRTLLNSGGVLVLFAAVAVLLYGLDRLKSRP